MTAWRAGLCLLAFVAAGACAAKPALPLWQVDGDTNRVWLLGSVHLLRASDHPLPEGIYAALAEAEAIVMELDMDDLDPLLVAGTATRLGTIPGDGTLAMLLGEQAFLEASELARRADIPLAMLARTEPWFAALTVEQLALTRLGFEATHGVEAHLVELAAQRGIPIEGLETIEEQLSILDRLPLAVQRELLLETLADSAGLEETMNELIDAWKRGDMDALASSMLADMQAQPAVYEALVVRRNRNWQAQLDELLDDEDDYLVVVGALHLVGKDGLPAMLAADGKRVTQLTRD